MPCTVGGDDVKAASTRVTGCQVRLAAALEVHSTALGLHPGAAAPTTVCAENGSMTLSL